MINQSTVCGINTPTYYDKYFLFFWAFAVCILANILSNDVSYLTVLFFFLSLFWHRIKYNTLIIDIIAFHLKLYSIFVVTRCSRVYVNYATVSNSI